MIERLRSFIAALDAGSFGEAARRRGMTQSALSKQIQTLERELGGRLLDRGRNGTHATELGRALVPRVRRVIADAVDLTEYAHALRDGKAGELRLGFGLSSIVIAPREVARFRAAYPEVEVSLEDMSSTQQVRRVLAGSLHAGFVRLPVLEPLMQAPLGHDCLAVAVRQKISGDLDTFLSTTPLVKLTRDRGPGLAEQIDRWAASRGLQLKVAAEAHDLQTVLALVASGSGPALVPASARRIAPPELTVIPLVDALASWEIGLVWASNETSPLTRAFVQSCTHAFRGRDERRLQDPVAGLARMSSSRE